MTTTHARPSRRMFIGLSLADALGAASPEVRKSLIDFGLEPIPGDAAETARYIDSETELWRAVIRERGIKLER